MAETTPLPLREGEIPTNPLMHLSQELTRVVIHGGVRINVHQHIPNLKLNKYGTGLADLDPQHPEVNNLFVPAQEFTKQLNDALRLDQMNPSPHLQKTIEDAFLHEFEDDLETTEPGVHLLTNYFGEYHSLLRQMKELPVKPAESAITRLRNLRARLETKLNILAGLDYYNRHAERKLALFVNEDTLKTFYGMLSDSDQENPFLPISVHDEITQQLPTASTPTSQSQPSNPSGVENTVGLLFRD